MGRLRPFLLSVVRGCCALPAILVSKTEIDRRGLLASALAAIGGFVVGRLIPGQPQVESPLETADVGQLYHRWSRPGAAGATHDWGSQPPPFKTYADAARIALPDPRGHQGLSLEEALESRRSRRDYSAEPLSLAQLSRLLHAAQGITDPQRGLRAAPSAGALYPIELYAVIGQVTGLNAGLYHYAVQAHELELLRPGDFRATLTLAGLGQALLERASVCFVLSAIFQRTRWRYHERAYRYVLLEAGHVGQNLYLAATSMGLGVCAVGAFGDDDLNDLLGLDGEEEAALHMMAVGRL